MGLRLTTYGEFDCEFDYDSQEWSCSYTPEPLLITRGMERPPTRCPRPRHLEKDTCACLVDGAVGVDKRADHPVLRHGDQVRLGRHLRTARPTGDTDRRIQWFAWNVFTGKYIWRS